MTTCPITFRLPQLAPDGHSARVLTTSTQGIRKQIQASTEMVTALWTNLIQLLLPSPSFIKLLLQAQKFPEHLNQTKDDVGAELDRIR